MGAERRFEVIPGGKKHTPAQKGPNKGLYWFEIKKVEAILDEARKGVHLCTQLDWRGKFNSLSIGQYQYLLKHFSRFSENAKPIYDLLNSMYRDAIADYLRDVSSVGFPVSEPEKVVNELLARPPTAEEIQVESSKAAHFFLRAPRLLVKIFGRRIQRP